MIELKASSYKKSRAFETEIDKLRNTMPKILLEYKTVLN